MDKSLTVNQVLIYDTVVTNEGSGYSQQTGVFTSPIDGFYLFQIHAVSDGTDKFHLQLVLNDRELIDVNKFSGEAYGGHSNSIIVRLTKHDHVKVVCTGPSRLDGSSGWYVNSFSGR